MGRVDAGLAATLTLLALGCGSGSEFPDGGVDGDPCAPTNRVGFCPPRGVYAAPLTIELATADPTDRIFYTADGSVPSESSTPYSAALMIAPEISRGGVATIRAIAVHADESRTETSTHSYIFAAAVLEQPAAPAGHPATWGFGSDTTPADYEMDARAFADPAERDEARTALSSIPSVSVVLAHNDLWAPSSGIYMRPSASGPDWERPASVEIILPDGSSAAGQAGLSIQGGSSVDNWKSPKLSMRLEFDGPHGGGAIASPVFGAGVDRFENLILDAHLNNTWIHPDAAQRDRALYANDQYVSRLLNEAGTLAPRTQPVHLYLNGLYWGLYDLHERPDAAFAASHLGGAPGDWDVLRHDASTVVSGDGAGYAAMLALVRQGLDDDGRYATAQALVDTGALIDYMLINFYGGNSDWDQHNWYAAGERSAEPRFRFFSWDAEHVITDVNVDVTSVSNAGAPSEIWRALLDNPDFVALASARAAELYGESGLLYVDAAAPAWDPTTPDRNRPAAVFDALLAPFNSAILCESARWGDNRSPNAPYTRASWAANKNALLDDYFPRRSEIAASQLPIP